jgi:hypothetical protein
VEQSYSRLIVGANVLEEVLRESYDITNQRFQHRLVVNQEEIQVDLHESKSKL